MQEGKLNYSPLYVTLSYADYEAMLNEIMALRKRKSVYYPRIDEIVFMPHRLYGYLQRAGITYINELERTSIEDWKSVMGFGKKSLAELQELMNYYGIKFKE